MADDRSVHIPESGRCGHSHARASRYSRDMQRFASAAVLAALVAVSGVALVKAHVSAFDRQTVVAQQTPAPPPPQTPRPRRDCEDEPVTS
jgi:hypothetical protein